MSGAPAALKARMPNPVLTVPDVLPALQAIAKAAGQGGAPGVAIALGQLRASQLNGCSVCVDMHTRMMKGSGETDERLFAVSAWRDSPLFTDAERAALALAEAMTRISDSPDPVPDLVWNEAARHYTEPELASFVIAIALINTFNRINVTTRSVAGAWRPQGDPADAKNWSSAGRSSSPTPAPSSP